MRQLLRRHHHQTLHAKTCLLAPSSCGRAVPSSGHPRDRRARPRRFLEALADDVRARPQRHRKRWQLAAWGRRAARRRLFPPPSPPSRASRTPTSTRSPRRPRTPLRQGRVCVGALLSAVLSCFVLNRLNAFLCKAVCCPLPLCWAVLGASPPKARASRGRPESGASPAPPPPAAAWVRQNGGPQRGGEGVHGRRRVPEPARSRCVRRGSFSLVASPAVRLYHGPGYGRGPERERARQAGKAG